MLLGAQLDSVHRGPNAQLLLRNRALWVRAEASQCWALGFPLASLPRLPLAVPGTTLFAVKSAGFGRKGSAATDLPGCPLLAAVFAPFSDSTGCCFRKHTNL